MVARRAAILYKTICNTGSEDNKLNYLSPESKRPELAV
jgi:hypothetical protein